ncbi:ABC transporter ATP-binding protein [Nitratireductor pacificus]|uniref:ABC transporter n=1 Tax=Nitratireductor pacificus pht-3B TaxID=391937 RepID=K2M934_9HYPH|nr:ABC transporter ATP-binding protein [Nitratireductor pacificus]EKF17545.1 ABC transporter [Nitratireductor pacificus pht-3B]
MSIAASRDEATHEDRSDIESLRRAWHLAEPLKGRVARGVAYRFAQSMMLGLSFGVVIWVVIGLAEGEALTGIWIAQAFGLMALSLAGQLMFGYLSVRNSWLSSYEVAGHLRLRILEKLRHLPLGFHQARHRGDTVTVLTSDMQMLESFFSDGLPRIAQALGLPAAIFIVLLTRDWAVALATAASIAVALPVFVGTSRRLSKLGLSRQDKQAEAGARMIEFVQGLPVIRAFNRMAQGQDDFRRAIDDFRDISIQMVLQLTLPMALFGMIVMLGAPLVIWVTGLRTEAQLMEQGAAITGLILLFSMYGPLLALLGVMETVRMADASLVRMDRILSSPDQPEPADLKPQGHAVRFDAVNFSYDPAKPVLRDVSFEVPERSMTAIVGPSGSGKSTVLSLISRFWDANEGRITIGGADVTRIGEAGLSDLVTVVFQQVYLFAGSIRENIAMGKPGASEAEIEEAARAAQAHDFITRLPNGYDTEVGEGGAALSGGERQRVAIARAILKDAPVVLMDEATAAIDPTNERAIQTALARLVEGRTLIVVAHKLSTIQAADQILVLDDGHIVERGRHEELLSGKGLYARLWSHRARAAGWKLG